MVREFLIRNKAVLGLSFLFLLVRSILLTAIPIFNDEAIYLDWGWRAIRLPNALWLALTDAKQPLLLWVFGIAESIFNDPLAAGRFISVLAGLCTLMGVYCLTRKYLDKNTAVLASVLYIVIPLFSFFDRQALMESTIAAVAIWSCYYFLAILEKHSARNFIILGFLLGIGFFVKSTMIIFVAVMVFAAFLLFVTKKVKNANLILDILYALGIAVVVLFPLFMQLDYWKTLSLNHRYSMTFSELLHFPMGKWVNNFTSFISISFWHLTPFLFLATLAGIVLMLRRSRGQRMMVIWFVGSVILFLLVAQVVTVRYVEPFLPMSAMFSAVALLTLAKKRKTMAVMLGGISLAIAVLVTTLQIFSPLRYFDELSQLTLFSGKGDYVSDQTAGYAVTQAATYIQGQVQQIPSMVSVALNAGNPENAILTYLHSTKTVKLIYLDGSMFSFDLSQYDCLHASVPVYFVSRENQLVGLDKFFQEEKQFYNPGGLSSVGVYLLKSDCKGKTLELH